MEKWETWTKEELENQMSPSRWNPTKYADEVISQHISVLIDETRKARQRIPHKLDVSYGPSDRQRYDVYGTDLPEESPIVFWVHGGYWQEGSKDMSGLFAQNLYENGVKTIVLGYTLAPQVRVGQIQEEFYNALGHAMQDNKGACFIVAGHSAGGQLTASLLHEDLSQHKQLEVKRLRGMVFFAGVFDLRPLVPTYVNDALQLTRDEAERLSPLLHPCQFSNREVPILVCVGSFDSPEFQRQSRMYVDKLKVMYTNVQLWISSDDDHFTLVEGLASSSESSSARYVLNYLKTMKLIK